jgi:hypothetical protein
MVGQPGLLDQAAVMTYVFPEFRDDFLNANWQSGKEFSLWFVLPVHDGRERTPPPDSICGVPIQEEVIPGPNQRFVRSLLVVKSIEGLLSNGGFEIFGEGPLGVDSLEGWLVRGKGPSLIAVTSELGGESGMVLRQNSTRGDDEESQGATLTSTPAHVIPSSIVIASLSVLNPVLTYHSTNPEISLVFYQENGAKVSVKNCPSFQSNLAYDEYSQGEWQRTFVYAIVPPEATQVAIEIEFLPNSISGQPIYVDDIRLENIVWEEKPLE